MRKVTASAIQSFNNNESKTHGSNTRTFFDKENKITYLFLHENLIAKKESGKLFITNAGWQSNTTKERLNAINGVSIYQKNWVWYLNDKAWDGNLIEIK